MVGKNVAAVGKTDSPSPAFARFAEFPFFQCGERLAPPDQWEDWGGSIQANQEKTP
jgi:hypothetical protein